MATTEPQRSSDPALVSRRGFVLAQVGGLQPLEFVTFIAPWNDGFAYIEVLHDEHGDTSTVEVGAAPPLGSGVRAALEALGFTANAHGDRLRWKGGGADHVADVVTSVLESALAVAAASPLDVRHGSRRAVVELERKLAHVRERVRMVVGSVIGAGAIVQDEEGDLVFPYESTRVWVGIRVLASAQIVVRVFALAAVEVDPTPALGLFLAQANFALPIGKFSLDPVHRVAWFEEALLGEAFSDDELRHVIELVAVTTNEYDDQIAHMFGGRTAREAGASSDEQPDHKPGSSGYL